MKASHGCTLCRCQTRNSVDVCTAHSCPGRRCIGILAWKWRSPDRKVERYRGRMDGPLKDSRKQVAHRWQFQLDNSCSSVAMT